MNWKSFRESFISDAKKGIQTYSPPILKAIVILIVSFLVAGATKKYIQSIPKDLDPNKILYYLLSNVFYYIILFIGILIALVQLGFHLGSVLVIFGSVGLAIALSIQSTITQIVSGMVIITFHYFNLGDLVEVNGNMGMVDSFDLFNTTISLPTGEKIIIPNNTITNSSFKNYYDKEKIYLDIFVKISNIIR